MPIFEYNGKKYNVPDDKVEGFKSRKPEATLINSAPFYLADDKTVKNPQSANTVDPVQDDITNAAQRQDGFWATGVGDAIEKLGAGTLNTVGGIAKVLQETPTGKLVKKFSDYATEKTGVKPLIENNDVAGYLSKEGQKLSEKGDFHGKIVDEETGQVRKKTYRDLWKEGNKLGALGEVMLTATESAPTSALAMMPGGLALVSVSAAGQKYSEINSNPETKDLPEWKKWLNASVSGVIEGATEKLGAKVDLKMIEPFLKKMTETTVKGILKKGGVNALIQTISEGAEEVLSQLGANVVDYATGVSDEYKPFEGVQDSFVYGAGGGAQFGGVTGSAAVYRASTYAKDRHNANKVVKDADQQAGELFDGWDEVKSQLSGMSAEERTETLRDVLKRDNISIPAKKAFTDYVSGITYKESLTGAAEAKAVQDAEAGKETGQRLYDTLKDKRSIALSSLNIEKQELEAQLGDLASLPLTEIEESPEATPDIINAARKYNIVKSEFDGVMDRLRSEVDAYVQPQIESLEQVAKDGTITELNIGSSENPETVYLLSGDISFNEDGTVNREASLSPTINVKGIDGKKRQIGTHHVVSGKVDDLEQTKEAIRQMAYDKYVNPLADKMEGKRHFELNETVEFVDDKGKTVAGKVNGKQGQAVQVLHSDGKTTSTFTESELDQRLIGESLGDIRIRDKFPVNIDGETLDAEVQDISDGKATLYIPNNPVASRRFIEVSLDEINEMRTMSVSGPQEIDKTLENTPQNEGVTVGSIQQNETETAETVSESQNSIEEQAQTVQEFPKDKDGNIDYAKITDNEAYVEALRSEFGDEAHNVVDEYKKAAEKALKGVDKINDPIRKRREQARRQAELDRWNVMFEATRPKQQAPTYEEEYNPILTKNSRERESQMGDYVSLRDFLLRNIGTGKLRFMWNSRDGRKGLKDEILSSKNTNAERLRRIAFLDNNGFTPESLAEFINDNHGQDIPEFSTLDVQDVRNEINDVLLSFDTPTDMIEAAERLRRDDMSLESYTEQNVSPEEIANYEANDVSQNELLLTLPEQETPEISEQELIEYYGNERGIEDIEQYPDTERGVYRGTEKRDQISLQAASDGVEAAEERQTGEQGARDSFAEPDQERAEQAIAGYDNQEDGSPSQGDGQGEGNRSGHPTGSGSGQQQPKGQQPGSIEAEAAKVDVNPTEAQKEAGNYKKGHVTVSGFDITIENPKGSVRSGVDASGKQWSVEMKNHYGYFKRTEGYDGDQIDTFIGPNPKSSAIFVVDQVNNDKTFDESKVMLGFNSIDEAREAYLSNYEAGWQGLGAITETTVDDFKKWLYDGAKQRKAFSEYKENKPAYGANNKIITTDRYNELREQMRKKLNNLNVGFDPEVFSIGAQMAMYHIESGAHKFADFAKRMVDDLGDAIRPYLKASYEGARAMPGMEELSKTMDPYNDVVAFDVNQSFEEAKEETKEETKKNKTLTDYKLSNKFITDWQKPVVRETWSEHESVIQDIEKTLKLIPKRAEDGMKNTVYAHYFIGSTDIFILEVDGDYAYTYTILNGDTMMSEFGEQYIPEITGIQGMELDFYWEPRPLDEVLYSKYPDDFENPNINKNEQRTRSTEAIEAETETIESASDVIRSESENVGSNQQRAADVKEQADEQVKKVETLLIEVEQKLANLKLSGKNYSTVEDALEQIKQEKGTPEQFKAMLLKNGAKQAELDYMDFDGAFTGKSVTKTDIQDWIDQNRIEVQEVEKGNRIKEINEKFEKKKDDWVHNVAYDAYKNGADRNKALFHAENIRNAVSSRDKDQLNETAEDWEYLNKYNNPDEIDLNEIHDIEEDQEHEQYAFAEDTKYSQYTLPGGKNYKELLLKIPDKANKPSMLLSEFIKTKGFTTDQFNSLAEYERNKIIGEYERNETSAFRSSHFDEPNILAHVRFNDREVNGERVLFLEEIQSDWAQKGKKEGFRTDKLPDNVKIKEVGGNWQVIVDGRLKGEYKTEQRAKETAMADFGGVPNMPFKKTDQWVNLALRRMMMYAAENDYDRIAWTTGEQQADRYDLSKQISELEIRTDEEDSNRVAVWVNNNLFKYANKEELPDIIGKEMAKKAISDLETRKNVYYSGLDLKVGGEGMIAFYDQIVPKAAKKLGKPFGADVETINLPISNEEITQNNADDEVEELAYKYESGELELDEFISEMNKIGYNVEVGMDGEVESANRKGVVYKSVQSIPVTDALREIAPNGMPLFRKRDTEAREAYAMREWNRAKKAIDELAAKMGVSVEIIETTDGLPKAKAEAKGWYDTKSKKIAIVMPNHSNSWDAQATFLHEAVGHHGLRELFGEHFDTFLDNVYNNAEEEIKAQINKKVQDKGWAVRKATEEYLSELAEDQEILQSDRLSGFFNSVKKFFFDMLAKIGFNPGFKLSNNELKYILWRSYQNLAEPGRYRSVVDQAKDVAMQYGLKVGNYEEKTPMANVAEDPGNDDIRYREKEDKKKLNTLFDNADNLSKVVPNYPDFLNRVLQNSPKKQEIFRDARERGWNNLDKAIESYMASVEDADELGRIREMLGVEVPDNALRYLLWRNANPNDGSPRWIAEEALKRKEFDGNAIFQKGKAPTKSAENEYEKRVRSRYNKGFRSLMFGIEEGWFDRMASLRILQNAITGNKAVPDKANAYMLENQLSSRNTSDIRYYNDKLIDPVIEQLQKVFGRDKVAADNYLNAKHGLERNVRMARQEADRWKENAMFELMKKELDDAEHEQAVRDIEELTEKKYNDNLKKDYSGLTALANEYDRKDFEEFANELVSEVENRIGKEEIDKLWNDINKATKWILDKQYNSGLMTKENYENIRSMYEYYVPLRGFAELTATDLYEYLQNPPSDFNGVLKTARGRTSKAESPVLSIMNMGESGIMQANRNRMKQAFYRLVATNPSNYASIEDVWLVKSGNDWQERFPEIDPNASGDEVADAIAEFNNEMAELAAKGEAVQGKNKLNVGVKILPAQASEHAIRVWIGGQEKVVYINGNPRAAQAINGLTQNNLIKREAARRSVEFWSRQMAANFTSRNPAFMITNFMRDVQFALISATVKEGGRYSAQLASNVTKVGKTIALNVWGKENTGNAEFQKYWDEFLANGGETGYANLHSIDQHRKYVNKKLREFSDQRDFLKPFREYTKFMENGNRMIEDMSRFATYVTSRQSGRSIERSVSDAKEITINFNRKGSGGFGANLIHSFYLFANPALQSMRLLGMMAKNHPVRFTAMLSSSMAMGTLVPLMNELLINLFGDDDDKDAYWNMAEWTRRNNLVLYMPGTKDKFVTLMLPHELRAFYGIGEMGYSYMNGRLRHQNMIAETAKQLTAMMPIDPFGGHDWWVPDAGKPLYQSFISNKNFMDRPIYKDTPWNKLDPEWTKAYKSTPSVLVEAAKWINEQSGGDEVVGGRVNLNPARAYHIFSGYMGGFLTTYTDLANVGFNLLTGSDVSLNDVPVGNKLIRTSDEKTAEMKLNSEYFYYLDWMREYEHAQSGYKKRVQEKDYRDKYIKLRRSNEGSIYRYAKKMRDAIDKLQGVNEEKAMELKKEFVEKMWEYEGG